MAIPNVTMRWAQNKATCQWCEYNIEPGQAMVVVFFWNRGANGRKWNVQKCYHPNCWVEQGMDYLNKNPYSPYIRGRKGLQLSKEDNRQRFLIVRRYHALTQRIGRLDNGSEPIKRLELEMKQADMMLEMLKIGGVPKKWLERL